MGAPTANSQEAVSVVASVAAIEAAYREGTAVIQRLKSQAASQRASPPPRILEEVIDEALQEIAREQARGVARFGPAFDHGDPIAIIALQQATIQLQGTLLKNLRDAAGNREVDAVKAATDFSSLVDVADHGREQATAALAELQQRLSGIMPSLTDQPDSPSEITPRASRSDVSDQLSTSPTPSARTSPPNTFPDLKSLQEPFKEDAVRETNQEDESSPARSTNEMGTSPSSLIESENSFSNGDKSPTTAGRQRHGSLLGFLRHRRQPSDPRRRATIDRTAERSQETDHGQSTDDGRNGNGDWAERRNSQDLRRRETRGSIAYSSNQSDTSPEQSRSNSTATLSQTSSRTTQTLSPSGYSQRNSSFSGSLRHPTPENNFLGFCRGAWKLQNGDRRAMHKSKEFNDGWSQSPVFCLMCTNGKCAFAGHIPMDVIWTKVWSVDALGLQFRWPFLAKSHVLQAKIKDNKFRYQCLFCAILGQQSPPIFDGTDPYIVHVSKEHRGRLYSELLLFKTGCVVDHICEYDEEYDINLFPLTTCEQADLDLRMREEQLAAEEESNAVNSYGSPARDTTSPEPWNAGLSEFHYDDEFEATEKES